MFKSSQSFGDDIHVDIIETKDGLRAHVKAPLVYKQFPIHIELSGNHTRTTPDVYCTVWLTIIEGAFIKGVCSVFRSYDGKNHHNMTAEQLQNYIGKRRVVHIAARVKD